MRKKIPSKVNSGGSVRRKKARYAVKKGALVLFKKSSVIGLFKPRTVHSGTIINISLSGIRAQYTAATAWSKDFDKMSIVTIDKKIAIDNIPCKIISDSNISRLPNGTFVRKCSIKYGNFSDYHKLQLSYFMQEYAIDPNNPKPWHIEFS
jgi:hypothetical protein